MPSTVIRSIRYDLAQRELSVTFQSGKQYRYDAIPPELYDAFKRAFSKGEFFNAHIRDRYSFVRDSRGEQN
jgi:KTSC domain